MNEPRRERVYLSELKIQIEVIDRRIAELEDQASGGALDPRFRRKDKEEAAALLKRRREIENKIINYEP